MATQIDAGNCTLVVTLCLWLWTRIKLPDGCYYQESCLRRQNAIASWAFGSLLAIQFLGFLENTRLLTLSVSILSGLVFFVFACGAYGAEGGFWSKRRNQIASLVVITGLSLGATAIISLPILIPTFAAFAISHLCRKRYSQIVASSIRDLDAIHAKLLKQEAQFHNTRNFEHFPIQKTS